MNQETNYGTNDLNRWNDVFTPGNPAPSTLGTQEDLPGLNEIKDEKPDEHLDIHNSNLRLDKYLFYFSSRL